MPRLTPIALALLLAACSTPDTSDPAAPADGPASIAAVQGRGPASPYLGRRVVVEGVVAGVFTGGLGGVYLQSETPDGDPATSEGLFVARDPDARPKLRVGDRVRITGTVAEQGEGEATLTSLVDAEAERLAEGVPVATEVLEAPPADWEALEGMRVAIPGPLTVTGNDGLLRYGELMASFGGRLFVPTELAAPGPAARAVADDNARLAIRLDDGRRKTDPGKPWFLPGAHNHANPLRTGSELRGVLGVVDQRFGSHRIQLLEAIAEVEQAPRPAPPDVAGDRRIAGFNLLNLFNGDGKGGGFPTPRGAATEADYQRQQAKLVATVQALDPDLAALMEIENDGYGPDSSIARFVDALNRAGPHEDWAFVDAGDGPGDNPIRVGIVYRKSRVSPVGRPATLTDGPFADRSRAPLAQAFRAGDGPVFVVAANHFKSKGGCGELPAGDPDADARDGQGCFNATRVETARRLHAWLATDPTGTAPAGHLVIGDLNAYAQEDPLRLLREKGWQDAFTLAGVERPYSFVYDGRSGRLDHALLDAGLAARLRGAAEWHANADESARFGYENDPEATPWRASDHDPLLLGLDLAR